MRLHILAAAFVLGLVALTRPSPSVVHVEPLILDDPSKLRALEDRGLSFARVVGPERLHQIKKVVESDMRELTAGHPSDDARRPFNPAWIERGRFELVGLVNRIDRRHFEDNKNENENENKTCGEARLVYRLALRANPKRPPTRLPMTVNVRIPQPKPAGDPDCRSVAKRWLDREDAMTIMRSLPEQPAQIEINFQSLHAPASRQDMDDSAGYVLRSFVVTSPTSVEVDGLFNTPRPSAPREAVRDWIKTHKNEIDAGSAVLPKELLAERIISVSPRGLARADNRPFSSILGEAAAGSGDDDLDLVLRRRLDEMTCAGCHQSRGVAGFHLLGEERTNKSFNTLALGQSPHLVKDLDWRALDLTAASRGEPSSPRPLATHPKGGLGDDCIESGGAASPTSPFACKGGLECRHYQPGEFGICVQPNSKQPGAVCEDITKLEPSTRAEGPIVTAHAPDATCPAPSGDQLAGVFCAPNWLGFTGGMCSERCDTADIGKRRAEPGEATAESICAPLPAAGYEADCFLSREPIEKCLKRHFVTAWVAACDEHRVCRADYGCARVPNAPLNVGACVPPYFIFQARVDGPLLDR